MQHLSRRAIIASGLGAFAAGCTDVRPATRLVVEPAPSIGQGALKPLSLSADNLTRISVCLRPFRPAGPRLEAEIVNGKTLIHNYGHGGSGWSLAWGYAEAARDLAALSRPRTVAVLGAGAMGLTAAIALAQTGAKVTVYAREFPMETPSSRASGVWSPSSRIGFASQVDPGFERRWEAFARRSYARHMHYAGRAGSPVEFTPRYYVRTQLREPPLVSSSNGGGQFLHLDRTLRDMTPRWSEKAGTPFPSENGVRGGMVMTFNIAEYTRQLVADLQAMGGRIERAEIASLSELASLPGDVVINCSGYGAKALVGDSSLVPVRGQIAWMPAQTDRLYGVFHRNVMVLSRRDGLMVQETGGNDWFGFGDQSETPDRDEFLAALEKVAPIFAWAP